MSKPYSLKKDLKEQLTKINLEERPVFEPGEYIAPNLVAGAYSGGGGKKIVQEGLIAKFEDDKTLNQLEIAKDIYLPNAVPRQWLWILERKRRNLQPKNDPAKTLANKPYVESTLIPAISAFSKELYGTTPIHNTKALRKNCEAPFVDICLVKTTPADSGGGIHPDTKDNFKKQYALLSRLHHPNIPEIIPPYGETKKGIYHVARFVDGMDLIKMISSDEMAWRMKGEMFLHPETVIAIMLQIAALKSYMKNKISPDEYDENGMDDDDNISNFRVGFDGIVNQIDPLCEKTEGSMEYFSPEKINIKKPRANGGFEGKYKYNPKSAVFEAIGIPSFVLITNYHPFEGKGELFKERVLKGHHLPVRKFNKSFTEKELDIMVNNPLKPRPDERRPMEKIVDELTKCLEDRVGRGVLPEQIVREKVTKYIEEERNSKYRNTNEDTSELSKGIDELAND